MLHLSKKRMAKVIGLGGVFIKFKDADKMREWYSNVLGMNTNDYGVLFKFNASNRTGYLQLGTFPSSSDYFGDAAQQVMLNFRIDNMDAMVEHLKTNGVDLLDEVETYEYGKFLHIADPEGNRIELWEPVDRAFDAENSMELN